MGKKLELNKEVLRELTEHELGGVAGGMQEITTTVTTMTTQSPVCPSGATWVQECNGPSINCS